MSYNITAQGQEHPLRLASFLPGGTWTPWSLGGNFESTNIPMWTRDSLSRSLYLNQPTGCLRFKLSVLTGLFAGIVGGNAISLTINAAYRCFKVATLSHFWLPIFCICSHQTGDSYHFKSRCVEFAKDIARIVATPFAWLALLFTSWGGALNPKETGPRDGAKIFASIEIAMYGGSVREGHFGWARCYQPNANSHTLGAPIGNMNGH